MGAVMRAAGCFDASFLVAQGTRFKESKADFRNMDVEQARKRMPCFIGVNDVMDFVPYDTQIVVLERCAGATSLPDFKHPRRAFYIFGPEDGAVPPEVIAKAHHTVYVPSSGSMNLGACAYTVLYDRVAKSKDFAGNQPDCPKCGNYFTKVVDGSNWKCCACDHQFTVDAKAD
jgi:tRNA(Leu) C34 or U34 (ribose-2'-O)-methylase TrmL